MSADAGLALHRAIEERVALLREFNQSEVCRHVVQLLELLKQSYMHDLIEVTPQDLARKQGAVRQVIALHSALTAVHPMHPKV
jgi:hypothetical protein